MSAWSGHSIDAQPGLATTSIGVLTVVLSAVYMITTSEKVALPPEPS